MSEPTVPAPKATSLIESLLDRVRNTDPSLADDLRLAIKTVTADREFGLVFNRHLPETVELPGRAVRARDKVRIKDATDGRTWRVTRVRRARGGRKAELMSVDVAGDMDTQPLTNLTVIADFRDPIYPGLKSTGKIEYGGDKPFHTVINAENMHALEALTFTHAGAVDCIYIDPPYNTRANDWKYNNDYVDPSDTYAHSKWLAFMERRLRLAKKLLNPADSVLIVTIDEKEYLRLGLLLEQTFPNATIQMISSVISPGGVPRDKEFTRVNEFIFFLMFGSAGPVKTHSDMLFTAYRTAEENRSPIWRGLLRGGSGPLRTDNPDKFFPILVDPKTERIVGAGDQLPPTQPRSQYKPPKGLVPCWPLKTGGVEGRWELSRPTFDERLAAGYVRLGRYNSQSGQWSMNYLRQAEIDRLASGELISNGMTDQGYLDIEYAEGRTRNLYAKTVWNEPSHDAGTHGKAILKALIPGRRFDYPKSVYAVEDALRFFVKDKPNALIVDFFAGSGTTTHAVMRLNRQYGGQRKSICVTNNEVSADEQKEFREQGLHPGDKEWEKWGICEYVTKPRIKAAVTGKTPEGEAIEGDYKFTDEFPMSEGFEENVEFFTLTYEDAEAVRLDLAFAAVAPMLWLRAGGQGSRIETRSETFEVADHYGVLFDPDHWHSFVSALEKVEDLHCVFVVTDDDNVFQQVTAKLPTWGGERRLDVVRLYENYLNNFEINCGRG